MGANVNVIRIALNPEQIRSMNLPSVPPKVKDSRTRNWDGKGVVELDAVEPKTLSQMGEDAIMEYFDVSLYVELTKLEANEKKTYQKALKKYVRELKED